MVARPNENFLVLLQSGRLAAARIRCRYALLADAP